MRLPPVTYPLGSATTVKVALTCYDEVSERLTTRCARKCS